MRRSIFCFLSLLSLTAGAPTVSSQKPGNRDNNDGEATHGVTSGEPGQGEHCCGMKGLGGATVEVLCAPTQVALGELFTVNVAYTTDIKRPIDVHVDLVNAHFKVGEIGSTSQMETNTGMVSHTMRLPSNATEPFLWKIFLTPRGEPFPNMLAETGFPAGLKSHTICNCTTFKNHGQDRSQPLNVDYVYLTNVVEVPPGPTATEDNDHPSYPAPKAARIPIGSAYPVTFDYNLVSQPSAGISASLMWKGNNTWIASDGLQAQPGKHTATLHVPVPATLGKDAVYIVVTMTPPSGKWEERLCEDRTYVVELVDAAQTKGKGGNLRH